MSAARHRIRRVLYPRPPNQVDEHMWKCQEDALDGNVSYNRLKASRLIETFLTQEGIPTFSVVDALRQGGDIGEVYYLLGWPPH